MQPANFLLKDELNAPSSSSSNCLLYNTHHQSLSVLLPSIQQWYNNIHIAYMPSSFLIQAKNYNLSGFNSFITWTLVNSQSQNYKLRLLFYFVFCNTVARISVCGGSASSQECGGKVASKLGELKGAEYENEL